MPKKGHCIKVKQLQELYTLIKYKQSSETFENYWSDRKVGVLEHGYSKVIVCV